MSSRKIIVALDIPDRDQTLDLARALAGEVAMVKLGLESFVAHGPGLVEEVRGLGVEVFLDLKLHDIPRTVAAAAAQASTLGVQLLTVHATGGVEMIMAASEAAGNTKILAVTVLTSMDQAAVEAVGFHDGVENSVVRLGTLAINAGADGLVCSARELRALAGIGGLRVVPGVRPAGCDHGDQKRVATPSDAVSAGANYLVIGRPIVQAADPVAAAAEINASIAGTL
ncbi:MAG: orotidine-5'-phosphate decarboxylase [Myxococcota bacterium]